MHSFLRACILDYQKQIELKLDFQILSGQQGTPKSKNGQINMNNVSYQKNYEKWKISQLQTQEFFLFKKLEKCQRIFIPDLIKLLYLY